MARKDEYYNRAKQEGYRARSAFKLRQLDAAADLFSAGDTVVDLGAAPGGWLQVAAERVGPDGRAIGVDRRRIRPLDADHVETVRGDVTDGSTRDRLRDLVGGSGADAVVSDMAPDMTGEYELDHARSVHLAGEAFGTARELLGPGGDLVVKVFQGRDLDDLRGRIDAEFEYVRTVSPDASRDASSEVYLVGKGRLTAPVDAGDRLEVDVVGTGAEGDGVATVDGYTLFVPGAAEGETVEVVVDEIKPRFGFAERVD